MKVVRKRMILRQGGGEWWEGAWQLLRFSVEMVERILMK
jgi:hypothetical protein